MNFDYEEFTEQMELQWEAQREERAIQRYLRWKNERRTL
jgi:hypothetical protein